MNVKVLCYKRPNLFDVANSMMNMVNTGPVERMFLNPYYKDQGDIVLYFPERFLNVLELRNLVQRCEKVGYDNLYIATGSEHILCTVHREDIRVIDQESISEGSDILNHPIPHLPDVAEFDRMFKTKFCE